MGGPGSGPRAKTPSVKKGKELLTKAAPDAARELIRQLSSNDPKQRLQAAELVLAYDLGKPKQAVEIDTPAKIDLALSRGEPAAELPAQGQLPAGDDASDLDLPADAFATSEEESDEAERVAE